MIINNDKIIIINNYIIILHIIILVMKKLLRWMMRCDMISNDEKKIEGKQKNYYKYKLMMIDR